MWNIVRWVPPITPQFFIQARVCTFIVSKPKLFLALSLTFFPLLTHQKMEDTAHISGSQLGKIFQVLFFLLWSSYTPHPLSFNLTLISEACYFLTCSAVKGVELDQLSGVKPSEITWLEEIQAPENLVVRRGVYKGPTIRRWRIQLICIYITLVRHD